ncbi:hypothetical protein R1flu_003332 [Riccia fluitans]|uniref:Uncharacterized protein n=1 Tax=Riccia fluitans TaxID=41844 RepID=A0ABD1Y8P4_9MARC
MTKVSRPSSSNGLIKFCKFIGFLLIRAVLIVITQSPLIILREYYFPPLPEVNVIWLRSSWKMQSLHTETVSVFLREVGSQSELLKDIDWTMSWTWQNNEEITSSMLHKIQINGDEIIANASDHTTITTITTINTPPISSTRVKLKLKPTFGDGVSGHPDGVCRLDGTCLWLGGWLPADVQQNGSYWRFLPNSTFGIPESTSLTLTSSVWSYYTCSQLKFVGTQDAEGYYLQDQTQLFSPDDGLGTFVDSIWKSESWTVPLLRVQNLVGARQI